MFAIALTDIHSAPVVGRQLAGEREMLRLRQELRECAETARLEVPLVQSGG